MNGKKAKEIRRICTKELKDVNDKKYMVSKTDTPNRRGQRRKPQISLAGDCGRFAYQQMKKMYLNGTRIV